MTDERDQMEAILAADRAACRKRIVEQNATIAGPSSVFRGAPSHSAAYLLQALAEAGWELQRVDSLGLFIDQRDRARKRAEDLAEKERIFREFVVYLVHMCEEDGYDCTCRPCVRLRRAKQEFDAHLGPEADDQPEKLTPPGETA